MATAAPLYDEGNLLVTNEGITFKWYYFPLGQSKFVPWSDIKGVERIRCGLLNSKTWGMPFRYTWWHLGHFFREFTGEPGLIIKTDAIEMGTSPADCDKVEAIINEHIHRD